MLAAEANEVCENEKKKTIMGEHVLSALHRLGFDDYVPDVRHILSDYQSHVKVSWKRHLWGPLYYLPLILIHGYILFLCN
jgi:hypothetical protein